MNFDPRHQHGARATAQYPRRLANGLGQFVRIALGSIVEMFMAGLDNHFQFVPWNFDINGLFCPQTNGQHPINLPSRG